MTRFKIKVINIQRYDEYSEKKVRDKFSMGIKEYRSIFDVTNLATKEQKVVDRLKTMRSVGNFAGALIDNALSEDEGHFRNDLYDQPLKYSGIILSGSGHAPLTWGPNWVKSFGDKYKFMRKETRWIYFLKKFIQQTTLRFGTPFLGICWGHQALARCFGGTTAEMPKPEIGLVPIELTSAGTHDPLLRGMPKKFWGYESHSREVGVIPGGCILLASGNQTKIQAIRYSSYHAWGVQFHPEFTPINMTRAAKFWKSIKAIPPSKSVKVNVLGQGVNDTTEEAKTIIRNFRDICESYYTKTFG